MIQSGTGLTVMAVRTSVATSSMKALLRLGAGVLLFLLAKLAYMRAALVSDKRSRVVGFLLTLDSGKNQSLEYW